MYFVAIHELFLEQNLSLNTWQATRENIKVHVLTFEAEALQTSYQVALG